jgi:hypothetical protein
LRNGGVLGTALARHGSTQTFGEDSAVWQIGEGVMEGKLTNLLLRKTTRLRHAERPSSLLQA